MNLIETLNQSNYIFYFLVVDKFLDINLPQLKNFEKIYISDYPSIKIKNSGKLLSDHQVIDYILKKSQDNNLTPVIIPFKPSGKVEYLCQKYQWIYAANPAKLNRLLEDKIDFYNICQKENLPTIPVIIDKFNEYNFKKYQQILNNNLVIQTRFGWAGKSTFSATIWEDIKDKIEIETTVKYSPYLTGYSLTNNCCLTKSGFIQSPPALQYTGLPQFTQNPFTTVGRQWPSYAPIEIIEEIKNLTLKFSETLKKLDYYGFFGLDFFISENQIFILECNPRLTASFDLYTQIEINNNLNPLFLFHLTEFLNLNINIDINQENKRFYNPNLIGSEITKKDINNNTIHIYRQFIPFSSQTNPIEISPSIIQSANEVAN
ncbi:MAG: ATP-grasp domain-containing protein [Candidatus Shapirobacteria bacterium]|nr:ATP-grasp domain-containing protein [Candidatus Shapirobacteria bacterium]